MKIEKPIASPDSPTPAGVETVLRFVHEGRELTPEHRAVLIEELQQRYAKKNKTDGDITQQWHLCRTDLTRQLPELKGLDLPPNIAQEMTLIPDGKEAFATLMRLIADAQESIVINMFVWRDDEIGNQIAQALLDAIEKNPRLKVYIRKDRLGATFELGELGKKSFWHWDAPDEDQQAASFIARQYNTPQEAAVSPVMEQNPLAARLLAHKDQVTVERDAVLNDHSKFVIVDGATVWTGGRNFGDEYRDRWRDLSAVFHSKEIVDHFKQRVEKDAQAVPTHALEFSVNKYDAAQERLTKQEIQPTFEAFMQQSEPGSEVMIEMAYFGDPATTKQMIDAAQRGVKLTIITAQRSNLQNDLNKRVLKELLANGNGNITVYLHPQMVHTKAWLGQSRNPENGQFVWDRVSFGSANLNAQAINELGEMNLVIKDSRCPLIQEVRDSFLQGMAESVVLKSAEQIQNREGSRDKPDQPGITYFDDTKAQAEFLVSQNGKQLKKAAKYFGFLR